MGEPAGSDHPDFPKRAIIPLGKPVGEVLGVSFKKGPPEVISANPPAPTPRLQAGHFLDFPQDDWLNGMSLSARETEVRGERPEACGGTRAWGWGRGTGPTG